MAGTLAALQTLGPLLGALAIAAGGFATAEVYEHTVPWGLQHQRDAIRDSIPGREATAAKGGAMGQSAADKPAFDAWAARVASCDARVKAARDTEAASITATDQKTSVQASAAYRLGRASCGVPRETASPNPGDAQSGGVPAPGDDFADAFAAPASPGR